MKTFSKKFTETNGDWTHRYDVDLDKNGYLYICDDYSFGTEYVTIPVKLVQEFLELLKKHQEESL